MAITKKQLEELLKDMADDVDVTENLRGIEGVSEIKEIPFDPNNLSIDDYKNILEVNKSIQGYNQSQIDSHISKGVESFKSGKMQEYIEDAVKKATIPPDETPEQKAIREMREQLETMRAEKEAADKKLERTQLAKDVRGYLKEQYKDFKCDVPDSILERCLADDMESTKSVIDGFMEFMTSSLKADRENYFNNNNPQPGGNGGAEPPTTKMSLQEAMAYANEHPEVDVNTLI